MKNLYLIVFAFVVIVANAQTTSQNELYEEKTTLYHYGKPLTTCETNLDNLFSNVPKYIESTKELELLSYKYIGIVENADDAYLWAKKNSKNAPPWSLYKNTSMEGSGGMDDQMIKSEVILEPVTKTYSLFAKIFLRKRQINSMAKYIHQGDRIYLLRFIFNKKNYEQYVFINPETKENENIYDVFGFEINRSHFDFVNNEIKK